MQGRALLIVLAALVALLAVLRSAGDLPYWRRQLFAVTEGEPQLATVRLQPRLSLAGEPRGMPRALPSEQGIADEAIAAAIDLARQSGARAFLVHRRGHEIAAHFGNDATADDLLAGGDLAPAMLAITVGTLVDDGSLALEDALSVLDTALAQPPGDWRNPWSAAARARFALRSIELGLPAGVDEPLPQLMSERLWRPLGAQDAALWGRDGQHLRVDCCVMARPADWVRLGDLLLQQGQFEGERIVSAEWIRQLLAAPSQGEPLRLRWLSEARYSGAEPPAARDAFGVDLADGARLWLVPQRQLVILHWAGNDDAARDTTLPNIVIRGIVDMPVTPAADTPIGDLVPAH